MKTKHILLTAGLLFSVIIPAQAQSDNGGFWDGIQSTFNNTFNTNTFETEAKKALRIFMVFNSDISMLMKSDSDRKSTKIKKDLIYVSSEHSNSMYAEYDRDNLAQSMHLTSSAYLEGLFAYKYDIKVSEEEDSEDSQYKMVSEEEASDHYQYTDKEGYWYTPFDDPNNPGLYVKTNVKKIAISVLNGLYDIDVDALADKLIEVMEKLQKNMVIDTEKTWFDYYGDRFLGENKFFLSNNRIDKKKIKKELNTLLNDQKMNMVGFPIFIHWAMIYSPDEIKSKFNVIETTQACNNLPDGCTKLTVASGKEKGKSMVFDKYDRLIFIDSKKEGTVKYNYDRDLTVILPPAMTFAETLSYYSSKSAGEKRKNEMDEAIKRAEEKAKRKAEKKKELDELKKQEEEAKKN